MGHSTQIYVSTPFSPPREWLWVPFLYVTMQTAWFLFNRSKRDVGGVSLRRFAVHLGLSMFLAFLGGVFFAGMNTAPPPGFGPPNPAFTGYASRGYVFLFLIGNAFGLLVLSFFIWRFLRKVDVSALDNRLRFAVGAIGIYLLAMVPYALGSAMHHGWHGGYVYMHCKSLVQEFGSALAQYAIANDGKLPDANSIEELKTILMPYANERRPLEFRLGITCPFDESFERSPDSYVWNSNLAGRSLQELVAENPDQPIVYCDSRYHYTSRLSGDPEFRRDDLPAFRIGELERYIGYLNAPPPPEPDPWLTDENYIGEDEE